MNTVAILGFERGEIYQRSAIHDRFGGNRRTGICPSRRSNVVFCFNTGRRDELGYLNEYNEDGSLSFFGRGLSGDQAMKGDNEVLRRHASAGMDLLVFDAVGNGKVRFSGPFSYVRHHHEQVPASDGTSRTVIVFDLVPLDDTDLSEGDFDNLKDEDLANLRLLAETAANAPQENNAHKTTTREAKSRSRDVARYVLARADGICEGCNQPAPFTTPSGRPYLETHHIDRLSDGGPDHFSNLAAVCPTCHRRAHSAHDRVAFNAQLRKTVEHLEQ